MLPHLKLPLSHPQIPSSWTNEAGAFPRIAWVLWDLDNLGIHNKEGNSASNECQKK